MQPKVIKIASKLKKIILKLKFSKLFKYSKLSKQKANFYKAIVMCLLTFVGIRVLILGVACVKEAVGDITPLIYSKIIIIAVALDQEIINLSSDETSTTFNITADNDWQLVSSASSWCFADQTKGIAGTSLITVTLTGNNTDINPRRCIFTILGQNLNPQPTVIITQLGSLPNIFLESNSIHLSSTQFREIIEVVSNIVWTVSSSDSSWCSPTKRNNILSIEVSANTSTLSRTCILTLSGDGVNPNPTYTITQSGSLPTILLENVSSNFSSSEGGTSVNVVSNTNWTVSVSSNNDTWCAIDKTSGSGNGVVNIRVTANNTISSRNCLLTFTSPGVNPSPIYVLTQSAGDANLSIDSTSSALLSTAGSVLINVSSNTNWSVTSSESWCTLNTTGGSNNGSITISAIANSTISARNCIVTFSATGVSSSIYTLTQAVAP